MTQHTIYVYTTTDLNLFLAKNFYKKIKIYTDLREIPWTEIIFRKVRFLSLPPTKSLPNLSLLAKRKLIKLSNLLINKQLMFESIRNLIFANQGPNVLFVPYHHAFEIYSLHCPQLKVVEIDKNLSPDLISKIYKESQYSKVRDLTAGVAVFINPTSSQLLRAYKLIHPNKSIVIRYHDMISWQPDKTFYSGTKNLINMVKNLKRDGIVDKVESYCPQDAELLCATYRPNAANPIHLKKIDKDFRESIYHFIGGKSSNQATSSRIQPLDQIQKELSRIYPEINHWCTANIVRFSNKWLSYNEFLEKSVLSEVCVDLIREDQNEGFSFRIPEAIHLNKKIISNRINLKKEPFYSPERIFLIGHDPIERLREFLEFDLKPLPKNIADRYNSTLWWTKHDPIK